MACTLPSSIYPSLAVVYPLYSFVRSSKVPNQQVETYLDFRILTYIFYLGKPQIYRVEVAT